MLATNEADRVYQVDNVFKFLCGLISCAAKAGHAIYIEFREATITRNEGDAWQANLLRKVVIRIELDPLCAQSGISGSEFIDDSWRENMRLANDNAPGVIGPIT